MIGFLSSPPQEKVDLDLFGEQVNLVKRPDAYAAMSGTGPDGMKCRNCDNLIRIHRANRKVSKCGLLPLRLGKSTDISMNSPACSRFIKSD